MSFRTRLTSFFVLIVVIPMVAFGFLVFRLISDSQQGKADARASGVASAAASLYRSESAAASADARSIAQTLVRSGRPIPATARTLADQAGLVRVLVQVGARTVADFGSTSAVAPGTAVARLGAAGRLRVSVSEVTAAQFARQLSTSSGTILLVRQGSRTLGASSVTAEKRGLAEGGNVSLGGQTYRAVTVPLPGFGGMLNVTVLSSLAGTQTGSVTGSQFVAAAFIAGVIVLALAFSVMASRGLQGQVSRFLQAARRLASGDFSSPIKTEGRDEFAELGTEFNNMSNQLERRLDELSQERSRLRSVIQRIGQIFASNLDRPALLELALKTAIDAVEAAGGRLSVRSEQSDQLAELVREGSLDGMDDAVYQCERAALSNGDIGELSSNGAHFLTVAVGPPQEGGRVHGLITVAREGREFTADDRTVLRSLASQAALALENVGLHVQVSRQAVTDELTGLTNHRRFQELMSLEVEQVRRYHHPVGLIMLDIDDFKSVNDTYGHQQGDLVLRRVARVLADTSRDADFPARYGGEELALILPHTDMEGSYAIAERIRTAVEALRIPRVDQEGTLRVTASLGVAAATDGTKEEIIAEADAALYEAKRQGKNRTIRAEMAAANVSGAE
jgi:diguanylate cyclase (GGDEF)-like protein